MVELAGQIREIFREYTALQGRLFKLLGKQANAGKVCDCLRPEHILLPTEAMDVRAYCAQCGGEINED